MPVARRTSDEAREGKGCSGKEIKKDMMILLSNPLLVIIVIFILSLAGAFTLFKLLKSMAIIKKAHYQAGGALAGFLLIFGTLYGSFYKLSCSEKVREPEHWTIIGTAKREKENDHKYIEVRQIPPNPTTTDSSGRFRLDNVEMIKDMWPELLFESENYFPRYITIDETTAEIDANRKEVRLKEAIELPVKE